MMKKKLVKFAIAAALLVGAAAPVSASFCDLEPTTFEIWFAQKIVCR